MSMDLDKLESVLREFKVTAGSIKQETEKLHETAEKLSLDTVDDTVNGLINATTDLRKMLDEDIRNRLGEFSNELDESTKNVKKSHRFGVFGIFAICLTISLLLTSAAGYYFYDKFLTAKLNRLESGTHSEMVLGRLIESGKIDRLESSSDGLTSYIVMNKKPDIQTLGSQVVVILEDKR